MYIVELLVKLGVGLVVGGLIVNFFVYFYCVGMNIVFDWVCVSGWCKWCDVGYVDVIILIVGMEVVDDVLLVFDVVVGCECIVCLVVVLFGLFEGVMCVFCCYCIDGVLYVEIVVEFGISCSVVEKYVVVVFWYF